MMGLESVLVCPEIREGLEVSLEADLQTSCVPYLFGE